MAVQVETVVHDHLNTERAAEADATTLGHKTTETTAPPAGESGGLPQFQFQHWPGQIAYLLILFALLYVLMWKVFAPRIRKVFDERARVIDDALTSARKVQAEAGAHAEDARKAVADARAQAERTASEAKAKSADEAKTRQAALEAELHAKLADADARIRASRDQAMAGVSQVASESAAAIVEKFTGLAPEAGELAAAQG
jgi:F-type H+-transporting ATPase subunit b